MKVKSIFERLDGCWSDSWDSLTDEQQDAWKEAGFTNAVPKATTRTINEAGVVRVENVVAPAMERTPWIAWDWLTPEQRESHARQYDATHALCDPVAEARAFDLVFQLDDAEKTAARLREAAEWSTGLERESNIRQLQEAEAEVSRISAELDRIEHQGANEPDGSTGPEVSTPVQRPEHRPKKGVPKAEILAVDWPLPSGAPSMANIIKERPKWASEAWIDCGRRGGDSHLWNPALLAVALASSAPRKGWTVRGSALDRIIKGHFPDFLDQWESVADSL
ncbi:hypothetical protein [Rhodocyclus purpureus]|uniref:hypothetical protein n=1 Tax=Rhodocyclus purpureus TaxID=1067 RepID=UPI00191206AE|nr:hypothetical protein [Rhodocyclus purpureus]MBK5913783.1 hypothetical protein [Rhodocyclus purpureus]